MSSFSSRMKRYEEVPKTKLTRRTPVIMRLDGKAFSTLTHNLDRPFDEEFHQMMCHTAKYLCENIQGVELAYTQSDEISLLITDYENLKTEAWFDYKVQKMTSVGASFATAEFNYWLHYASRFYDKFKSTEKYGHFDCRVFNIPKEEVCNYFIWRQKDATRNSIQGLGQHYFSHNEMQGVSNNEVQDKLFKEEGVNWDDLDIWKKRGVCIVKEKYEDLITNNKGVTTGKGVVERTKWVRDEETSIFTKNRDYIEQYVFKGEDSNE